MTRRMLIDALHPEESRVVIVENNQVTDYDFVTTAKKQIKANIYLGKITRVEPSLQAAFVEYGGNRQGFLPFAEIHPDYYQIPTSDRKRLIEEAIREEEERQNAEDEEEAPRRGRRRFRRRGGRGRNREETAETPTLPSYELDDFMPASEGGEIVQADSQPQDAERFDEEDAPHITDAIVVSEDQPSFFPEEGDEEPGGSASLEVSVPNVQSEALGENELGEPLPQDSEGADPAASEGASAETTRPQAQEVETLTGEEDERRPTRRPFFSRRYKIQEVIKRGQVVLVQVIKEERGTKGASLSTYISLPGRYCVLMPNTPNAGGISRKIPSSDLRKKMREMLDELKVADGMSVIIRTAGMDRSRTEIKRDFDYLVKLWNTIREETLAATAPALIYEEGNLTKRTLRDLYRSEIDEVHVEGDEAYRTAKDFMKMLMPSHAPRIKHYRGDVPIFYYYGVEDQLLSMHEPAVRLRSGGYIVVNPTEALIAIDVNSGRSTSERNIEETALKTNLEAAHEVARQIRLRDLAGLIVIDFIDMMDFRNRRTVERTLKDLLRRDRAKIQVGRISPFGLLEMSRQRMRPSISEASMTTCPHCQGSGHIRSNESMSIQIVRALEKEAATGQYGELRLITSSTQAQFLFNRCREMFSQIEQRFDIRITVVVDSSMLSSIFRIEKNRRKQGPRPHLPQRNAESFENAEPEDNVRRGKKRTRRHEEDMAEENALPEALEMEEVEPPVEEALEEDSSPRRRGRRGGRGRGRHRESRNTRPLQEEDENTDTPAAEPVVVDEHFEETVTQEEDASRESRRRGRRGGRGRNRRGGRDRETRAPRHHEKEAPEEAFADANASAGEDTSWHAQRPRSESSDSLVVAERVMGQEAPVVSAYNPPEDTVPDPTRPKRTGWWKRMTK